uniref:Uncharacterized protein n=1 Tax=Anguilla anguilla TaxID=7936 RepID=A0A0E9S9E4_ANGAN
MPSIDSTSTLASPWQSAPVSSSAAALS